jgi:hypothetical protein
MALTKYDKKALASREAEKLAIQEWLKTNMPTRAPDQVGGPGMVVMRDDAAIKALDDLRTEKNKQLGEINLDLASPDTRLPAASIEQQLDEAAGVAFRDPNAKRANSLAEVLAAFNTANVGEGSDALPDMTKRAQANLLAGSVNQPKGALGDFVQLLRTSVPGMGNQESLEMLMQQINNAKGGQGSVNFGALGQTVASNRTPIPDEAATRAALEVKSATSGKTIEQLLADSLSENKGAASQLADGVRGLSGLGAEARQVIKGRQLKAIGGATAVLTAGGGTMYGLSGPSEIDKQRQLFYDTFYAGGGGPGAGILSPKDDKDYGEALSQAFGTYATKMLGEPGSARYKSYGDFVTKNRATIDALGKGDLSFTAEDEGLKEFRRGLADFYSRNGYKEDKPLAFGYRNKEGKNAVFMTGKKGDRGGRMLDKGEFQMMDE